MSQPTRTGLHSILVGDELGQIKLIQLNAHHTHHEYFTDNLNETISPCKIANNFSCHYDNQTQSKRQYNASTLDNPSNNNHQQKHYHSHRVVRILDNCLQQEPAASRAITTIRPINNIYESNLDTTDKANNLFLIANKVGQLFVCDTDSIRNKLKFCTGYQVKLSSNDVRLSSKNKQFTEDQQKEEEEEEMEEHDQDQDYEEEITTRPMLSPIYYNMNSKVPICGAQPINQTNILVVYQNGDIQNVNIGQEILQSSLRIKRKAIRMLGLGYNSDARAVHWRIDGQSGICYIDTDAAATAHMAENDPLTDIVLSSPTHKLNKNNHLNQSQKNLYQESPCIKSRKYNQQDRLIPTQVINMITSHSDQHKPSSKHCKWTSITSLNLLYKKLALYDLIGSENFEKYQDLPRYRVNCFKLSDNRLAIGGSKYHVRVYDVQTQRAIYNTKTGAIKNPLCCSGKGELFNVGDIDWLGGNKTTQKCPNMLAVCSGYDSIVQVFDLRSPKAAFHIDLTQYTGSKMSEPYENHPRGCMFTKICASAAPYSTAVPSQQLALGSTNGQLHVIDLRFVARSHRTLGRLSGFCGGSIREIRFVSESFETSKMISCATDRFVRVHKIQTSFTSVVSQKLATKVFLGTRPTSIQPVCDQITSSYLASIVSRCNSETHVSTMDSENSWSLL